MVNLKLSTGDCQLAIVNLVVNLIVNFFWFTFLDQEILKIFEQWVTFTSQGLRLEMLSHLKNIEI